MKRSHNLFSQRKTQRQAGRETNIKQRTTATRNGVSLVQESEIIPRPGCTVHKQTDATGQNTFQIHVGGPDDYEVAPFTVVIDTREQAPYSFTGIKTDVSSTRKRKGQSKPQSLPLIVPTVVETLKSGDYSIRGHELSISVERKSLQDLYGTLSQRRKQFVAELERLNEMPFAAVVVESGWESVLRSPATIVDNGPHHVSQLLPKTIYRSILAWQQRYVHVHWLMCPARWFAERTTFRILERYWKDLQKREKQKGDE